MGMDPVTTSDNASRLVLVGPPGAGKGTQAAVLRARYRLAHVSTGDLLREQVRQGTPLGREASSIIRSGQLVPDQVILDMVEDRLRLPDTRNGFILDGFPRSPGQVAATDNMLRRLGKPLTVVVELALGDDEIVRRLSLRRTCSGCGRVYHLQASPPQVAGRCDADGAQLIQREDDCESVIRTRLKVYHEQTTPVVTHYRRQGLLERIDASQPIATVERQVSGILDARKARDFVYARICR